MSKFSYSGMCTRMRNLIYLPNSLTTSSSKWLQQRKKIRLPYRPECTNIAIPGWLTISRCRSRGAPFAIKFGYSFEVTIAITIKNDKVKMKDRFKIIQHGSMRMHLRAYNDNEGLMDPVTTFDQSFRAICSDECHRTER